MMTRREAVRLMGLGAMAGLTGCARGARQGSSGAALERVDAETLIFDVIAHPLFEGFGRFLFPISFRTPEEDMTLADLPECLPWYSEVHTETTVDVINELLAHRTAGKTVFFDIYSDAEKEADPSLEDTGLFWFEAERGDETERATEAERGDETERAPFAIVSAGGGFAYVASMHDSFPHALHLSRAGIHGFALQYRPDAQLACEDLARAVSFVFTHADELGVDTAGYALWGGSAGARMAAWVGGFGPAAFGASGVPRPAAVIMQYTGLRELTGGDPATYACVGTSDGIASWRTMRARLEELSATGVATEFHRYEGLHHGFGLGLDTVAEGWIDDALAFWLAQR